MCRNQLHGVLLAGGMSRRFGSPKAFASYKGKYFYQWIIEAMVRHVDALTIVSHESLFLKFSKDVDNGYDLVMDVERYRGFGPLAGIYTAMKKGNAQWYLVMACDIPLITSSFVDKILSVDRKDAEIIIPFINGKMQPLAGLYHHSVFQKIEGLLEHGDYKMKSLLEMCQTHCVDEMELNLDGKIFMNINDLDEYEKLNW